MDLGQLLDPRLVFYNWEGGSKKRLLRALSQAIVDQFPALKCDEIFDGLVQREKLGSTGVGQGVAIPHCRLSSCERMIGLLAKLSEPIDFDAPDSRGVDLVFVLIVPLQHEQAHLETLSRIAQLFHDPRIRSKLRKAGNSLELYKVALRSMHEHPFTETAV